MMSTAMHLVMSSPTLLFLLTISASNAQDLTSSPPPSLAPATLTPTTSPPNNNDDFDGDETFSTTFRILAVLALMGIAGCARAFFGHRCRDNAARREVQQTMTIRRQHQTESNTSNQGLAEEERNHARYEAFVTKFLFQTVLPDKSNITASSLRRSSATRPDEEHPSAAHTHDDDDASAAIGKQGSLSRRLSSWRRPSAKDECCICLECYAIGETICAPITTECNHVFHEGCINEWLKKNDKCPLCRVELLKD